MRKRITATLLACGMAAVGLTGGAPAHAAETCNGLPATIIGTDGNDHREGTPGKDVFLMKGGDDAVSGLGGDDTACMGAGDDTFTGGGGDDTFVAERVADGRDDFFGDDGRNQSGAGDLATYAARTTAVKVSLDGSHNDGQAGEGDNIAGADVDAVRGESGADVLTEHARASARCSEAPATTRSAVLPAYSARQATTRSSTPRAAGRGPCTAGTAPTG